MTIGTGAFACAPLAVGARAAFFAGKGAVSLLTGGAASMINGRGFMGAGGSRPLYSVGASGFLIADIKIQYRQTGMQGRTIIAGQKGTLPPAPPGAFSINPANPVWAEKTMLKPSLEGSSMVVGKSGR